MRECLDKSMLAAAKAPTFVHFITPNDVGQTGGHQCGFYVTKEAAEVVFGVSPEKGSNIETSINIRWIGSHQGARAELDTESHFKYYGCGTRNESRITRFNRGFPFLDESHIGDMVAFVRMDDGCYEAYVLSEDADVEEFFTRFGLALDKRNQVIGGSCEGASRSMEEMMSRYVESITEFPGTGIMSKLAEEFYENAYGASKRDVRKNPDRFLQNWYDAEYMLFKLIEQKMYASSDKSFCASCDDLIKFAGSLLNRRKARAGKSLEHHLASIFTHCELRFEEQTVTEDNKRPDFLFPDGHCYQDFHFPADMLTMLGAKTTCKDRWRQVLNEADRIPVKHLFTLQHGVSKNQLAEMRDAGLILVVPKDNLDLFDKSFFEGVWTLERFVGYVAEKQGRAAKWFAV